MKYLWPVIALVLVTPVLVAQDYGTEKPPPVPVVSIPLTSEQKAALHAVDVRMAGVEALLAKIDDPDYKATAIKVLADLQKRRAAMGKNFDQGLYEALMHAVISRYQTVALWLTPPRTSGPGAKPVTVPAPAAPSEKKSPTNAATP